MNPVSPSDLDHILAHTRHLWQAARGKRIFISGGTGFFGAWLLESLLHCNDELNLDLSATVLTRNPEEFTKRLPHLASHPSLRLHPGDVRDFLFPEDRYEFVIHAATSATGITASHQFDLLNTIVDGTKRMLAFATARGARNFLFVSSGAVYGRQPQGLTHIPEDYCGGPNWLEPSSAYAEGKRVGELMCSLCAQESSVDFRIARCFAFVGPHLPLDQHFAIGNFIRDALAGRNISIHGDGTPMRSYLYAADLAIWLWTLMLAKSDAEANPLVLNVGSPEAISIGDLAKVVAEELNPSAKIEIAMQSTSDVPILQYVPDVQRAQSIFGLQPTISLREAIRRTARWHQSLK